MTAQAALHSKFPIETITVRAKPFTQLENEISALRSMISITDHMVLMALDRDRIRDDGERNLFILFSPEMVRDLQFASSDLVRRMESIFEKIDAISAEAFDDQG